MDSLKIFLSVGGTANEKQESFIQAIEERLRSENLIPNTVGRNQFSVDSPLKAVIECMKTSSGAMIIALERTYFPYGIEKRGGPKESELKEKRYATPWNQIEAALAYSKGLPIMIIVEEGIQEEGLLEKGYDWYVMAVKPDFSTLNSKEFNGVLASWKKKVEAFQIENAKDSRTSDLSLLTTGEFLRLLKPSQIWAILAALASLLAGAFALGANFHTPK
ncbi:hypothetical protein [Hymenobacter sp. BT491]|uniref:hypothetical protein n=1 Tax=Hymenobacter sp. BT491 TaxID=2766779 RepID=UPI00165346D1|nr:hypothetical protein [Hymenobacter sp. BT491]MBC6989443.1 hypothetical protein [Hymenobacter sp. BT491]